MKGIYALPCRKLSSWQQKDLPVLVTGEVVSGSAATLVESSMWTDRPQQSCRDHVYHLRPLTRTFLVLLETKTRDELNLHLLLWVRPSDQTLALFNSCASKIIAPTNPKLLSTMFRVEIESSWSLFDSLYNHCRSSVEQSSITHVTSLLPPSLHLVLSS